MEMENGETSQAPMTEETFDGDLNFDDLPSAPAEAVQSGEKIIEYVTMNVQTKTFDSFIAGVQSKAAELGGYIESSNIDGSSYGARNVNRSARFVLRIPSGRSGEMTGYIGENGAVVSQAINTENVTLAYVDMESRISALTTEKEALEALLAKADNTSDIIYIQNELTSVIYRIESYKSQLRTYDNLVDYTTLTLTVSEVERVEAVEKQGVFERIGTNLKNNFEDVGSGLLEFLIWFIGAIPYFLLLGAIGFLIWLIVWLIVRSAKKRRARRNAAYTQSVQTQTQYDKSSQNK